MIPQFEKPELRFIRIKPNSKSPIEADWTGKNNYPYAELKIGNGENYGVLCGAGGLVVLDFDRKTNEKAFEEATARWLSLAPRTFSVKTPSGGFHFYYFCPEFKKKVRMLDGLGEIQSTGTQVVAPPSKIGEKTYEIIDNAPISTISKEEIENLLDKWLEKKTEAIEPPKVAAGADISLQITDVLSLSSLKQHGNEYFGAHPVHGSENGMNFWVNPSKNAWHCFRCDSGGDALLFFAVKSGFLSCPQAKAGALKGRAFVEVMKKAEAETGKKLLEEPKKPALMTEKPKQSEELLDYKDYRFFEALKPEKKYLIEGMLLPKTVTMLYSPPAEFKSLISMLAGMCIANGRPFLGLKTQKNPVLLCDKENNAQTIKKRLTGIKNGLRLRKKDFPLLIYWGEGSLDELAWIEKLQNTVQKKGVKLVIFDTLHRFSDYEENAADDLNRLYTTVFQPLVEKFDCSVLFLHHCTKEGGYRGTSDFLGQVDSAYALKRLSEKGKSPARFFLNNEKNRWGEMAKIEGTIDFDENGTIRFGLVPEGERKLNAMVKISVLKEVTNEIGRLFPIIGASLKRQQIYDHFEINKLDYSEITIKRSLNYLVLNDFLEKGRKGEYIRRGNITFGNSMSQTQNPKPV